ncbi:SH3 domain-containing protein [Magnetospirillum fulvum]|uniref:SH3 domain-containing protein n=1 Tax=Magnetospirillum fulvum TaxID=1082 RepID=A0A1H6GQG3_MAGFU|nr:SH3 domain-containing protein [Magnetospirillum fulvum]SEH25679.1 SH3 domain-containing protein [Magnetospirillum fulvum]
MREYKQNQAILPARPVPTGFALGLAGLMMLNGCVTANNQTSMVGGQPVVVQGDLCSIHRQPIADIQRSTFNEGDVATTALVGIGVGVLTGVLSGNSTAGIAAGVGGALATALVSYLDNKRQASKDQASLLAAIDGDAVRDGAGVDKVAAAVSSLRNCRLQQFQQLGDDLKAGKITKEQARSQFQTLTEYRKRDDLIVNEVLGSAEKRASLYTQARMKTMNTDNPDLALGIVETPAAAPAVIVQATKSSTPLRNAASSSAPTIGQLPAGSKVELQGENAGGWTQVRANGQAGYIRSSALTESVKKVAPPPVKKPPEVAKFASSVKTIKKQNESSSQDLASMEESVRTLLD